VKPTKEQPSVVTVNLRWLWSVGTAALIASQSAHAQVSEPPNSALPSPSAQAQDVSESEAQLGDIVVTGSRIAGFDAPTPTTTVGAETFENIGALKVGDVVNLLPVFVPTLTQESAVLDTRGPSNSLNLRGLGAKRTLTLVNKRRFVPTSADGLVNTNLIPSILVKRLEIVTGGASAAWGSDAVAGVANIIYDDRFTGIKAEAQYGLSQRGDNQEYRLGLAGGTDFADGKGHIIVAGEYADSKGIRFQQDRDWANRDWGLVERSGQFAQVGVPNVRLGIATEGGLPLFLIGPDGQPVVDANGPVLAFPGQQFTAGGSLIPFDPGSNPYSLRTQGGDGAPLGRLSALVVPLERWGVMSMGRYEFSSNLTVFGEFSYGKQISRNNNVVQPFSFGDVFIAADNAYLAPQVAADIVGQGGVGFVMGRLNTDFGFIKSIDRSDTLRAVGGLQGTFGGGWQWQAYYQYGRSARTNRSPGNLVLANFANAADAVFDGSGNVVCRSTLTNVNDGCVPINLFGNGSPSAAAVSYVTGVQTAITKVRQHVVAGDIQGSPFATWAGDVSIAAGAEYRNDRSSVQVDNISTTDGFLIGNPKGAAARSIAVWETFGEVGIPLAKDMAFAKSLDLNAAVRYTDYSTSGGVTTWKAGATYEPIDGIKFRITRSRDIRAPNYQELFVTSGITFDDIRDPVRDEIVSVSGPALANENLRPERADTLTFGAVLQPSFVPGLRLSADYYDIKVNGVIASINAQSIVNRCAAGSALFCSFVTRDPVGSGPITRVDRQLLNLGEFRTKGIDFEADYALPLNRIKSNWGGKLNTRLVLTYVKDLIIDDGETRINQAGSISSVSDDLGATPHWRGLFSINYNEGPFNWYNQLRFVGSANRDNSIARDAISPNRFGAYALWDTAISFTVGKDDARSYEFYLNIKNVLDKDPPIVVSNFIVPQATEPTFYDVVGRNFAVGVRLNF
jgi:iron complex outermembrane recepter protein